VGEWMGIRALYLFHLFSDASGMGTMRERVVEEKMEQI
jgi:hypothetical protein